MPDVTRTEIRYIEGSQVQAQLPPGATHPRLLIGDELCVLSARVRKAFPLSKADGYISLQDGAGKEIGLLRSLQELDEGSRQILERELERRYFTPAILRIDSLKQDGGMWLFKVATQRGPATFYVRSWRDSSHEISQGRFQILSVDGQRFEIPDLNALDERSQAQLDQLF